MILMQFLFSKRIWKILFHSFLHKKFPLYYSSYELLFFNLSHCNNRIEQKWNFKKFFFFFTKQSLPFDIFSNLTFLMLWWSAEIWWHYLNIFRRYPPHAPQHSRHTLQHEERSRGRSRGEEMSRRPRSAKSVEDMLVDPRRISSLSSTSG